MTSEIDAFRLLIVRQDNEKSVRIKNQLTDQMQLLDLNLRQTEEGQAALRVLLDDRSSTVRLRAALAVLAFDRNVAVEAIERIKQGDDGPAWEAGYIIDRARQGIFNVDWVPRGRVPKRLPHLSGEELDSALTVHGLIMNGGLEHARDVDRDAFDAAVGTLRTIGRSDAAGVLAAVAALLASGAESVGADPDDPFRELDDRYLALPDVQDSIEDAVP
ncbi:hypothetical protein [Microbacterium sp.]|uniref:hypothetical protein n=1 Tax=Microbacterium sp. TaxID=51671 RepID=UPI0025D6E67C|nr:hypothetical protein [Microbacterium sp.]MBT9607230.1 hypothetical protein [Microbacterium sp.]